MINSKNPEQHTLAGRTSPLSPFKGVPPPPGFLAKLRDIFRFQTISPDIAFALDCSPHSSIKSS